MSRWRLVGSSLLFGGAAFAAVTAVGFGLGALWASGAGIGAGVVALLAASGAAMVYGKGGADVAAAFTAGVLAVGAAAVAADRLEAYRAATAGPLVADVSIGDAAVANASALLFHNAVVRSDLAVHQRVETRKPKGGGSDVHTLSAAPVVDRGWSPGQPVRVWSVCRATYCAGWQVGWRGALVLPANKRQEFVGLIEMAQRKHGLGAAADGPVVITLVADPAAAIADLLTDVWQAPTAFLAVWCAAFVLAWGYAFWPRRPAAAAGVLAVVPPDVPPAAAAQPQPQPQPQQPQAALEIDYMLVGGRRVPYRWTRQHGRTTVCEVQRDQISFWSGINPSYPEELESCTFKEFIRYGSGTVLDAFGPEVLEQVKATIAAWEAPPHSHRKGKGKR